MAEVGSVYVSVIPSMRNFSRDIRAEAAKIGDVEIGVKLKDSGLRRQVEGLTQGVGDINIKVDVDTRGASSSMDSWLSRNSRSSVTVTVNANTARADADLARTRSQVDSIDGRTARVNVDDGGSALKLGSSMASAAAKIGLIGAAGGAAAGGILAVAGAGTVAAAAIGPLALAFMGVGKALTAMGAAQDSAAQDAQAAAAKHKASANAIASAQSALADATRSAASSRRSAEESVQKAVEQATRSIQSALRQQATAQRALRQATVDLAREQGNLTKAWEDGKRALQDLQDQVDGNALDQRQAALDLQDAIKDLNAARAGGDANEIARAQLAYDRQVETIDQLNKQTQRLSADNTAAQRAGVAGSADVVAANERIAAAQQRVGDATVAAGEADAAVVQARSDGARSVAQAQADAADRISASNASVANAQRALTQALQDTGDTGSASMMKLNQAMSDLSPAAAHFATFLFGLKSQLSELSAVAAAGVFPGMEAGINSLLGRFAEFKIVVGQFATGLGQAFAYVGAELANPAWTSFFLQLGSMAQTVIPMLAQSFMSVAAGARDILAALLPMAPVGAQILGALGPLLSALAPGLGQMAQILGPVLLSALTALQPAFTALGGIVAAIAPVLGSLVTMVAGVLVQALQVLLPVIQTLAPFVIQLVNMIGPFLQQALTAVAPLLMSLVQALGPLLTTVLGALLPPLLQVIQVLSSALAPILPVLGQYLGQVAQMIGTLLVAAITAIAPILPPLIGAFMSILNALMPIVPVIGQMAATFITALAPILPIIANLIVTLINALLPIIPPLLQIVQALLPVFTSLLGALMPVISQLAGILGDVLVWVIKTLVVPILQLIAWVITNVLAPVLQWLVDNVIGPVFRLIGNIIEGAWRNVIKPVFDAFGDAAKWAWEHLLKPAFDGIGKGFSDLGAGIQWVWDHVLKPIFDGITGVGDAVGDAFGWAAKQLGFSDGGIAVEHHATGGIVGLATGGVLSGYRPGKDTVPAMLSPGEAVLVPELVRIIGAKNIESANAWAMGQGGRSAGTAGVSHYASGGVVRPTDISGPAVGASATGSGTGSSDLTPETQKALAAATETVTTALTVQDSTVQALNASETALSTQQLALTTQTAGLTATVAATTPQVATLTATVQADTLAVQVMGQNVAALQAAVLVPFQGYLTGQMFPTLLELARLVQVVEVTAIQTLMSWFPPLRAEMNTTANFMVSEWGRVNTFTGQSVDYQLARFENLKQGMASLRDAMWSTADWARQQYGNIQRFAADPIRWVLQFPFNAGIIAAWNSLNGQFALNKPVGPVPIPFATGGHVRGPGSGTSDDIPAMLSNGEFVVREKIAKRTMPFLQAFNAGQPEAVHAAGGFGANPSLLAGKYASGGVVTDRINQAKQWAQSFAGKPYIWGGTGPAGMDCSGYVGAVTHVLRGESPYAGRLGVARSQPWSGFRPGLGGAWATGWNSGHTAGTLAGTNMESSKTPIIFPGAHGADDAQFSGHAFLPEIGGAFASGGSGGAMFDPTPIVDQAFADTYKMIADTSRFFGQGLPAVDGGGIAKAGADGVKKYALDKLTAMFAMSGSPGNVESFRGVVNQALSMVGQSLGNADATLRRMNQESGGNPNAVNRSDINWRNGTPSVGLMQVIGPTYASNKDARSDVGPYLYGVSTNPLSNILASMHYAVGRYGSLAAAYNKSGGYDSGGLASGTGVMLKNTISPERVLSPRQTVAFEGLLPLLQSMSRRDFDGLSSRDLDRMGSSQGRAPIVVNQQLPAGADPQEFATQMAFAMRRQRMSAGVHAR